MNDLTVSDIKSHPNDVNCFSTDVWISENNFFLFVFSFIGSTVRIHKEADVNVQKGAQNLCEDLR